MGVINLQNIRQSEGLIDDLHEVRSKIEHRINLENYSNNQQTPLMIGFTLSRY